MTDPAALLRDAKIPAHRPPTFAPPTVALRALSNRRVPAAILAAMRGGGLYTDARP